MFRHAVVATLLVTSSAAHAVEAGDVIWLSSNGVSLTVTEVHRVNRETVAMTANQMAANASEYCERYEQLTSESPKWKTCIAETFIAKTELAIGREVKPRQQAGTEYT